MHLRHLFVQHCKLIRRLEVPFVRADGSPRMWTMFVGENGTCKTTLLRAIALATAGSAFANHLVDDPASYVDRRDAGAVTGIEAALGFSAALHAHRTYPGFLEKPVAPPEIVAEVKVGSTTIASLARYDRYESPLQLGGMISTRDRVAQAQDWQAWADRADSAAARALDESNPVRRRELEIKAMRARHVATQFSPVDEARSQDLPNWFSAAYGVGRLLTSPQSVTESPVPKRDRLKSLFDPRHLPSGTAFSDQLAAMFGDDRARAFASCLRTALVDRMHTPRLRNIELRGQGGARNQRSLIESHRFGVQVGGDELMLPAIWLSQGYQAVISLVADIIGNVWLEAGDAVALDAMEGIVLVDELDLHLHPTWQTEIVAGLKATFPRMQFIVTTHSPLVLAGCRADEVWRLEQDEASGDITARSGEVSPMLLTGSELNRQFFGVDRASPLSESLRRYLELASDPYRSDTDDALVRKLLQELRAQEIAIEYEPVARKTAS
jgi:hypothetical protein